MIGDAIQKLRPHTGVMVVEPEDLVPEAESLHHEVLFSHPRSSEMLTDDVGAWVEPSVEADRPFVAGVDGYLEEFLDLDGLLAIIDEAKKHAKDGYDLD